MEWQRGFLLKIARESGAPQAGAGMMFIVIRRPYAYLEKEMLQMFKGEKSVRVIVDRRYGERRTEIRPMEGERRRDHRRIPKQEMLEVGLMT